MYLIEFGVRYSSDYYINIFNKKKQINLFINKCNNLCNCINPIFCFNCINLIESELTLNYKFSNYVLKDKNTNKTYEVIRDSIKNDYIRMNYCNNNYDNSNYNEYPENFNYQNFNYHYDTHYYDQQYYHSSNDDSNYYFDDETKTLSDITFEENVKINEDINLKEEINENKVLEDKDTKLEDKVNEDDTSENEICEEINKDENEICEEINKDENEICEEINKDENEVCEEINKDENEVCENKYEISEEINKEVISDNEVSEKIKLSKKDKNKLKKDRKKQRKKEEKEKNLKKIDDEQKILEQNIELNKIEMIDKLSKLNIENFESIKLLPYESLIKKFKDPILYNLKAIYYKKYGKSKMIPNLSNYFKNDFNDLENYYKEKNENNQTVSMIKTYISKSEFNEYYFSSIYLQMLQQNLSIFIKDKNGKIYAEPYEDKNNKVLKFYELIFDEDDQINNFFNDYIIINIIKPFEKKKQKELEDYDKYLNKLENRQKITYKESLLVLYNYMNKRGGRFCFGKHGYIIFDSDNNNKKIYY